MHYCPFNVKYWTKYKITLHPNGDRGIKMVTGVALCFKSMFRNVQSFNYNQPKIMTTRMGCNLK